MGTQITGRWVQQPVEETKAIDLRKAGGSTPMRCLADPIRGGPARAG